MATLRPLVKPKIIKKRTKKFIQHQSEIQYVKTKCNWKKPRDIGNKVHRRFNDQILMSNIGYGNKKVKYMLPSGFQKFLVHNIKELKALLFFSKSYSAEIAHNVSSKNCKVITDRAAQLAIRVTNSSARCTMKKMNRQLMCMSYLC
ncbi:60S ribosomal protein L32-like [Panthera uncia]|uniref:60S ribosomal protein L32-like n=1 Tax=Panthera uncia TaxID=29064 RepID=UPI0020FFD9EE|nr:60S ribosomal protein L32-like [Panthera uncia]